MLSHSLWYFEVYSLAHFKSMELGFYKIYLKNNFHILWFWFPFKHWMVPTQVFQKWYHLNIVTFIKQVYSLRNNC